MCTYNYKMATMHLQLLLLLILTTHLFIPSLSQNEKCHPEDKKTLLQIKKELGNPIGLFSWNSTADCCNDNWKGVTCDAYNQTYRIIDIDLSYLDLPEPHPIPVSIFNLTSLNILSLTHIPDLIGEIPPSITKLIKLNYLYISNTNISGQIPDFLSRIKTIVTLDFRYNRHTGPLPASLPSLPNLVGITFDGNRLTGPIPDSYGSFSNQFTAMTLSRNQLSGKIPTSFGKLNLFFLDLSRNRLEGDALMLFGSEKYSARTILIGRNSLAFDIGKVVLPKNLTALVLRYNRIYGTLPQGLTGLRSLRSFNVSNNNLCGRIPVGGNMQRFDVSAYAQNKCLCGSPLPACKTN